jgi:hypothetical protein
LGANQFPRGPELSERLVWPACKTEIRPEDPVIFQDGKTYHLLCLKPDPRPPTKGGIALRGRSWGGPPVFTGVSRALLSHSR